MMHAQKLRREETQVINFPRGDTPGDSFSLCEFLKRAFDVGPCPSYFPLSEEVEYCPQASEDESNARERSRELHGRRRHRSLWATGFTFLRYRATLRRIHIYKERYLSLRNVHEFIDHSLV